MTYTTPQSTDGPLEDVLTNLLQTDRAAERWGEVIRRTYDMIYNGAETGRYAWDQLMKTEKTHFGTLFEINAQREFQFDGRDEDKTDYRIAGYPVDAKWSQKLGGWMLPPEIIDELALVATASDEDSIYSLGIVRVTTQHRNQGENRDKKSKLNKAGMQAVRWLFKDEPFPPNVLLQLDRNEVDGIMRLPHGTLRTDQLFRAAEGMLVHRTSVATVSKQLDTQRRVRANGGSRTSLAKEGYVILSGAYDSHLATPLGLPVPSPSEYVSVRVVPSSQPSGIYLDGQWWRRRKDGEQIIHPAPLMKGN